MYTILITGSIFIRMKVLPLSLYVIIGQKERSICKMPMVREMYGKTMARKWIEMCIRDSSCTGPIIGFLLVQVSTTGSVIAPAIGMLGFAIALALPFTLFALFPSWLKSMPKSGGWMNVIKVTLGFLELAFALKFLSVADLAYGWRILDRETFLALWIVIFGLMGLYLLGKIKFPHDGDESRVGVARFFLALVSLAFAVYMIPGLWGAPLKEMCIRDRDRTGRLLLIPVVILLPVKEDLG